MNVERGIQGAIAALVVVGIILSISLWFKFCFHISDGAPWGLFMFLSVPSVILAFTIGATA